MPSETICPTIHQNTNRQNLFQLLRLRLVAIFGQIVTILLVNYFLKIELPLTAMFSVLIALSLISCFSFYRYQLQKNISDKSLFFELLLDVAALTLQFYFSGGISNPFISLFILQVIIAAILLEAIYAWLIALITIFCYIALAFKYQHLHAFHHHTNSDNFFNLHLQGMLISYIFAAIILLIFITKIIKNLKARDAKINALKQESLQKEQVMRLGLMATGAAHELSTPLTTILVLLNDWKEMNLSSDLKEDSKIIETQIERCKNIISKNLSLSGNQRTTQTGLKKAKETFDDLIKNWQDLRNPQNLIYNFKGNQNQKIINDEILTQAFFNIFDNALEASPEIVAIEVNSTDKKITIEVIDQGKGFKKEILEKIGQPNISSKNSSGLGLFLAINILQIFKSDLKITNLENGAKVTINMIL